MSFDPPKATRGGRVPPTLGPIGRWLTNLSRFEKYQRKTDRLLPVIRLVPRR